METVIENCEIGKLYEGYFTKLRVKVKKTYTTFTL